MSEADYAVAYNAAHVALEPVGSATLRGILAESVAACVIGNGTHGVERWQGLAAEGDRFTRVVKAAMRDLPVTVSSGPVSAAVKAAAEALRDQA